MRKKALNLRRFIEMDIICFIKERSRRRDQMGFADVRGMLYIVSIQSIIGYFRNFYQSCGWQRGYNIPGGGRYRL